MILQWGFTWKESNNMITSMIVTECVVLAIRLRDSCKFMLLFFRFDKFVGEKWEFHNTGCSATPTGSYPMPTHILRCKCHLVEGQYSGLFMRITVNSEYIVVVNTPASYSGDSVLHSWHRELAVMTEVSCGFSLSLQAKVR